jgi:hypothetical protein
MTQPIYQPTAYSCMACVCAMITGEPLEEVMEIMGHDGSERHYRFLDCAAYLNRRGYHLGIYAGSMLWPVSIPREQPALVIVASQSGCGTHAVLWDGEGFIDPEPANKWRTSFDYNIVEWWPVTKYED